jgi:hypothetical protein
MLPAELGRCTVPPCDRCTSHERCGGEQAGLIRRRQCSMADNAHEAAQDALLCGGVVDCTCNHRMGPHLWAASTGLPGLRCASMPFADEVIFSFGPGVAAGGFRALEALVGVAAVVDMEGQNNNAGCELRESAPLAEMLRIPGWQSGEGAVWWVQRRGTLDSTLRRRRQRDAHGNRTAAGSCVGGLRLWARCQMLSWCCGTPSWIARLKQRSGRELLLK